MTLASTLDPELIKSLLRRLHAAQKLLITINPKTHVQNSAVIADFTETSLTSAYTYQCLSNILDTFVHSIMVCMQRMISGKVPLR